jgi:hypothetical protein
MEKKMKKTTRELDENTKHRLGVLWVLLNVSVETGQYVEAVEVMNQIEEVWKEAPDWWNRKTEIFVDGEKIFEFQKGIEY